MRGDGCGPGGVDCREALDRLEEYLDGELGEDRLAEIATHLAACFPCGDRAQFEHRLRIIVRERAIEGAPAGLADKVRIRVRQVDISSSIE